MIDDLHHRLHHLSTATVSMQLLKRGLRHVFIGGITPLRDDQPRIAGPAATLRFLPYREDLDDPARRGNPETAQRRAIEETPEGHVLVVETRGEHGGGVLGDILATRLQARGVAGLVTDGGIRDLEECQQAEFAMYGAGAAAPASLVGHAPAEVQCTIACGGVAVVPGDIIVADGDGVAVIPAALAADVARDGLEQERFERYAKMKVAAGAPARGTYPPNDQTRAAYQEWIKAGEPAL